MEKNSNGKFLEYSVHVIGWGLVFLLPLFLNNRGDGNFDLGFYLKFNIVPATLCALFYLNYLIFVPRYLFKGKTTVYFAVDIIAIAVLLILLRLSFDFWIVSDVAPPPDFDRPERPKPFMLILLRDVFSMILVSGLAAALKMGGRINEMENARKESEMTNLKSQINPHFLLNTLNNIYALIAFDSEKAQMAVHELSRLLRYALYDIRQNFVSLYKEVDFIRNYISLMELRLPANVQVDTDIDVSPASNTPMAPLLFISLIENAFKHGISPSGESFIRIRLFETEKEIHCEIVNSSYPKNAEDKSGSGIGLAQVQKRLDIMYEGKYLWDKGNDPDNKEYHSYLILKK